MSEETLLELAIRIRNRADQLVRLLDAEAPTVMLQIQMRLMIDATRRLPYSPDGDIKPSGGDEPFTPAG